MGEGSHRGRWVEGRAQCPAPAAGDTPGASGGHLRPWRGSREAPSQATRWVWGCMAPRAWPDPGAGLPSAQAALAAGCLWGEGTPEASWGWGDSGRHVAQELGWAVGGAVRPWGRAGTRARGALAPLRYGGDTCGVPSATGVVEGCGGALGLPAG